MDVSIIILNYRTRGLLKQAIKSIALAAPELDYEILVVDNASRDGSVEMIRERYPDVRLLALDENIGFACGNNIGIREARGRHILIMNPDIMMREGALEEMYRYMETHHDVGLLGPKLLRPDRSVQESVHRFPVPLMPLYRRTPLGRLPRARRALHRYAMRGELEGDEPREVDWMEGAALLVRKRAIEEVGMLDERFFMYMEDADWARRLWEKGWKVVWHPGTVFIHYHRRASADAAWFTAPFTNKVARYHIISAVKYFWKWRGKPAPTRRK